MYNKLHQQAEQLTSILQIPSIQTQHTFLSQQHPLSWSTQSLPVLHQEQEILLRWGYLIYLLSGESIVCFAYKTTSSLQQITINFSEIQAVTLYQKQLKGTISQQQATMWIHIDTKSHQLILHYENTDYSSSILKKITDCWQWLINESIAQLPGPNWLESELSHWNNTQVNYANTNVLTLFKQQAQQYPERIALVFNKKQLTYHELNKQSDILAQVLQQQIILPTEAKITPLIALFLPRSMDLIISILAILKLGCAYLPIDREQPLRRLYQVIDRAQPQVIIALDKDEQHLSSINCAFYAIDGQHHEPTEAIQVVKSTPQLAYVIFTSGSTGTPKGVMVDHQALINRLLWMQQEYVLDERACYLQKTPYSFDVSIWEIFLPLITGAKLVLAPPDHHKDPQQLQQLIQEHQISIIHFVPAMLQSMLQAQCWPQQNSIQHVFCSGERLEAETVQHLQQYDPKLAIHNLYGPTEATIDVSYHTCDAQESRIPIGRPIANILFKVCNTQGIELGINVPGELYISGVGLAQGYLQQPELTAKAFIQQQGKTWYKTGDRVYWNESGELEFLGRLDDQIKLRGLRIELGEIEAALLTQPTIEQAIVVLNEQQLVAYVVAALYDREQLEQQLAELLPDYMLPQGIVLLQKLPITSSGKIDRKRLPLPQLQDYRRAVYRDPISEVEQELVKQWQILFQLAPIGIDDHFFYLGGNSLLAIQLCTRLQAIWGCGIPTTYIFGAPTIAEFALLIQPLLQQVDLLPENVAIQAQNRQQGPLSFAQQRLWVVDQMQWQPHAYIMHHLWKITGPLDHQRIEQTISILIERHPSLRTRFIEQQQQIRTNYQFQLSQHQVNKETLSSLLLNLAQRPFDLNQDVLLRADIISTSKTECYLLLSQHHIASDGWSAQILFKELSALYHQPQQQLPLLTLNLCDHSTWQRQQSYEQALTYWRYQLQHCTQQHQLPLDHPRPQQLKLTGETCYQFIDADCVHGLKAQAEQQQATLFMMLHTALALFIAKHSISETSIVDTVIGTAIANRSQPELEALVGFFVNTLVLRLPVDPNHTVQQLLEQSRATLLNAFDHQHIPFDRLVEELNPERSMSHQPIVQIMLVMQNYQQHHLVLSGVTVEVVPFDAKIAQFDLTINVIEKNEGLTLEWQYNTALWKKSRIQQWMQQFSQLLEQIAQTITQPITKIQWLSEHEQQQLLFWGQGEQKILHSEQHLIHYFEQQVNETPQAIAISDQDQLLTYDELNQQINRVAHYLMSELNHQSAIRVVVCLPRGWQQITTMMALFKIGACYVPVDIEQRHVRLAKIVADATPQLIITQAWLSDDLGLIDTTVLLWENLPLSSQLSTNPKHDYSYHHLAYLLYTSGSTGQPKGVAISHHSLLNTLFALIETYHVQPNSRILQFVSPAFDVALSEVGMSLLSGANLFILHQFSHLQQQLLDEKITHLSITASALATLVPDNTLAVEVLIVGGEPSEPELIQQWKKYCRYFLAYGPTEASICSSTIEVTKNIHHRSLGLPITNTNYLVLDKYQQLAPKGSYGELYIAGAGLAQGYWHQEALTAERFVQLNTPEFLAISSRWYRTGDIVYWGEEGTVHFVSRDDEQIKLRGLRVELGEIKTALLSLDYIQEVALQAESGQLFAYLVADKIQDHQLIQTQLQQQLPHYMLPTHYCFLENLPLTTNGKIDHQQLKKQTLIEPIHLRDQTPAQNYYQYRLQQLWKQLLQIKTPGIEDNFFDLGGHSLLATRLISAIAVEFQCRLSITDIFAAPTIALQAQHLQQQQPQQEITHTAHQGQGILSYAQQRLWIIQQIKEQQSNYHIPLCFQLTGSVSTAGLTQALTQIIQRHPSLRTQFFEYQGEPRQHQRSQFDFILQEHSLSLLQGSKQRTQLQQIKQQQTLQPFDLEHDLLIRGSLIQLKEQEFQLLLVIHHIIFDGWSISLLVNELNHYYSSLTAVLPTPQIDYLDYSLWQQQQLQADELQQSAQYWQQQLMDAPQVHNLPVDYPRPANQSFKGDRYISLLDTKSLAALYRCCHQQQVTLFMLLHSALASFIYRYSGDDDIIIGTPVANRTEQAFEEVIGFFINTLVLRLDLSADPEFSSLLQQSKHTTLAAFQQQQFPFERLVELLNPERSLSHSPIFQIMLVLQNHAPIQLNIDGVESELLVEDYPISKFDLTLDIREQEKGLEIIWEYATDLFHHDTIMRMANNFLVLLQNIAEQPQQKISQLDLLSAQEKQLILYDWNNTRKSYTEKSHIHELFEQQAQKQPEQIALVYQAQSLTYEQLNHQANQLAHWLRAQGVTTGQPVAVCCYRGFHMVISVLATLKAGATYVPIDASFPQERIDYILEDSQSQIILTMTALATRFAQLNLQTISLEKINLQTQPQHNISTADIGLTSEHIAYIIYTSGSTGRPKGVVVQHFPAINVIQWVNERFNVNTQDRLLFMTSLCFDLSVYDIFGLLAAGGIVDIATEAEKDNPQQLFQALCERKITFWDSAPAALYQLSELFPQTAHYAGNLALRLVFLSGDWIPVNLPTQLMQSFPQCQVVSLGGATEATVWSNFFPITQVDPSWSSIPYGRPINNARYYVLDAQQQPCPLGIPGELYIGDDCLSLGYSNPLLTAERYIPDPFSLRPGKRLYRTGDHVRWQLQGQLEFIGRVDNQVKIRGFRIELGDIESEIAQINFIQDCAVLAEEEEQNTNKQKRLVAYIITTTEQDSSQLLWQLQQELKQRLPGYMIPSAFVRLTQMPITANGKLDRKGLHSEAGELLQTHYQAPTNPVEQQLQQSWQELLNLKQIGMNDNFFHLGGHSLLATRLVNRISDEHQVFLSLSDVFTYPSIQELAIKIQQQQQTKAIQQAVIDDSEQDDSYQEIL